MMDDPKPSEPDNWRQIWEKKGNQEIEGTGLERLLIYAGYDSISAKVSGEDFRKYVECICTKVGLRQTDRILEVGCGIGAFLHCLKPTPADLVGIDYSHSLISKAEKHKSNLSTKFYQGDADELIKLGLGKFDVIFSNGVFFYFPSFEYAARVCRQIVQSVSENGRIAILDVNDAAKKEQFLRMRYAQAGEARYKELYKGLDHLFFERSFFFEVFRDLGCTSIHMEDQAFGGYGNSPFRFNVFVEK